MNIYSYYILKKGGDKYAKKRQNRTTGNGGPEPDGEWGLVKLDMAQDWDGAEVMEE